MINGLLVLVGFQLVGEMLSHYLNLPIPGPVLGMMLLLVTLIIRKGPSKDLEQTTGVIMKYLGLFYIPAGAGLSAYFGLLAAGWVEILTALIVSTLVSLVVVALVVARLAGKDAV